MGVIFYVCRSESRLSFLSIGNELWVRWFSYALWLIAFLFPVFHTFYVVRNQRKHYGRYLYPPTPIVLRTWLIGLIAGFSLTMVLFSWKMSIHPDEIVLIWCCTLLFALWRLRFSCISYAVGFLSLLHLLIKDWNVSSHSEPWAKGWYLLQQFSIESCLWLVAFSHLLEWILIRIEKAEVHYPVQIQHRSGKIVSGFLLSRIWTVPLVLSTPTGWMPFPLVLGFVSKNCSKPMEQHKRLSSTFVLLYALILIGCLILSKYWELGWWLTAGVSCLGHEIFYFWEDWKERKRDPLFISDEKGLKVLAVLPHTPAAMMGLKSGDIIHKLNGKRILTLEDLEKVASRSAFLKMEVLDEQLDSHLLTKALYEDDPKHLGVVGAVSILKKDDNPSIKQSG
jgi:PDZ domain